MAGLLDYNPIGAVVDVVNTIGGKLVDSIFPDKIKQESERAAAALAIAKLQQDGDIQLLQTQLSAILAEANSKDPWTSRARPSFLYVIYLMILVSLPMGLLAAVRPETAVLVASGMRAWLGSIPDSLWTLFGAGYLGYSWNRTQEKKAGVANG